MTLGGPGKVVETDESCFGHGWRAPLESVFGLVAASVRRGGCGGGCNSPSSQGKISSLSHSQSFQWMKNLSGSLERTIRPEPVNDMWRLSTKQISYKRRGAAFESPSIVHFSKRTSRISTPTLYHKAKHFEDEPWMWQTCKSFYAYFSDH